MHACNERNNKELSSHVVVASGLITRMKGLLGRDRLDQGESLWIRPCNSVHTIGMNFPIDVVFLDKRNVVIAVKENLSPNRLTGLYTRAASVLELSPGTLAATDTRTGDRLRIV